MLGGLRIWRAKRLSDPKSPDLYRWALYSLAAYGAGRPPGRVLDYSGQLLSLDPPPCWAEVGLCSCRRRRPASPGQDGLPAAEAAAGGPEEQRHPAASGAGPGGLFPSGPCPRGPGPCTAAPREGAALARQPGSRRVLPPGPCRQREGRWRVGWGESQPLAAPLAQWMLWAGKGKGSVQSLPVCWRGRIGSWGEDWQGQES